MARRGHAGFECASVVPYGVVWAAAVRSGGPRRVSLAAKARIVCRIGCGNFRKDRALGSWVPGVNLVCETDLQHNWPGGVAGGNSDGIFAHTDLLQRRGKTVFTGRVMHSLGT